MRATGTHLDDQLGFLLTRSRTFVTATVNEVLREFDLHSQQYAVLSLAAREPSPNQREIAHLLQLDPSQVVNLVDQLVAAGLVERRTSEADGRLRLVEATGEGLSTLTTARAAVDQAERTYLDGLTDADATSLLELLRGIAGLSHARHLPRR